MCLPEVLATCQPGIAYAAGLLLLRQLRALLNDDHALTIAQQEEFERGVFALSHLVYEPCLAEHVLEFLRCAPPVFRFVAAASEGVSSDAFTQRCRIVCEAILRLLRAHAGQVRVEWDWHEFHVLLSHRDVQVKQLARAALEQVVGLHAVTGDAHSISSAVRLVQPMTASSSWNRCAVHSRRCISIEGGMQGGGAAAMQAADEDGVRVRHGVCFAPLGRREEKEHTRFVATPAASEAMRALLLAAGAGRPVLVSGGPGSGKTMFLRKAAEYVGQEEPVFLYCDEQTDIKTLLGNYVCGDVVGEFIWRPGVITEALSRGRWLVLEDVDKVPSEVLAALRPLASSRQLVLPDRNTRIDAGLGFQLFGTLSFAAAAAAGGGEPHKDIVDADSDNAATKGHAADEIEDSTNALFDFVGRVPGSVAAWTRVQIPAVQERHLGAIVAGLYPELEGLLPQLLASFKVLGQGASAGEAGTSHVKLDLGPREMLRWCGRQKAAP
jgi:hypothetical protein